MKSFSQTSKWTTVLCSILILAGCRLDPQVGTDLDSELDAALRAASNGRGRAHFVLPDDGQYSRLPQDPRNPITQQKVELGKLLFHETALGTNPRIASGTGKYSCASCHHAAGGFQAALKQGIGEGGVGFGTTGEARVPDARYPIDSIDVQPIRTPSALNITYQEILLWNGQFGATGMNAGTQAQWTPGTPKAVNNLGYHGTEIQAIAGMDVHRLVVDPATLAGASTDYEALFAAAFPSVPAGERLDNEHAGLAIAAFERTLLANRAPFQRWLRGEHGAMTEQEKRGAITFFGKANCGSCHGGPALNSMDFHALGMGNLDGSGTYGVNPNHVAHLGRGGFTGHAEDNYKFKVPQLYNLKDSPFYGHGGTFTTLEAVVRYKNAAVPQNPDVPVAQLATQFRPLNLSEQEVTDLVAFLERGLHDNSLYRYEPSSLPSGNCFPNNDMESRYDLGCN
ncbi:MAG: cytochrome c peroxidase [Bacteroidota bacterium]